MTFRLAAEAYGAAIHGVREIIRAVEVTRMPQSSSYMKGVINLRGKVIPVMDLRLRLGLPATEPTEQTVIIVFQFSSGNGPITAGVLVDQVLDVLPIEARQIEPTPSLLDGGDLDLVLGVCRSGDRVLLLLDVGRVLSERGPSRLEASAA